MDKIPSSRLFIQFTLTNNITPIVQTLTSSVQTVPEFTTLYNPLQPFSSLALRRSAPWAPL